MKSTVGSESRDVSRSTRRRRQHHRGGHRHPDSEIPAEPAEVGARAGVHPAHPLDRDRPRGDRAADQHDRRSAASHEVAASSWPPSRCSSRVDVQEDGNSSMSFRSRRASHVRESTGKETRCLSTRSEPARNGRRRGTSSPSSRPSRRSETRRSRRSVSISRGSRSRRSTSSTPRTARRRWPSSSTGAPSCSRTTSCSAPTTRSARAPAARAWPTGSTARSSTSTTPT